MKIRQMHYSHILFFLLTRNSSLPISLLIISIPPGLALCHACQPLAPICAAPRLHQHHHTSPTGRQSDPPSCSSAITQFTPLATTLSCRSAPPPRQTICSYLMLVCRSADVPPFQIQSSAKIQTILPK